MPIHIVLLPLFVQVLLTFAVMFGMMYHRTTALQRGEAAAARVVQQLQPVDNEIVLLAQADGGPPALPTLGALAHVVERGTHEADGDIFAHAGVLSKKINQYINGSHFQEVWRAHICVASS